MGNMWKPHPKQIEFLNDNSRRVMYMGGYPPRSDSRWIWRLFMGSKTYENGQNRDRIENNFKYHSPTPDQIPRYQLIRDKAKELAVLINQVTPASREQSLAFTDLEDCVMHANAAIARNE